MKYRPDLDFEKEKKFRRVSKNKDQKYRKKPYEILDEQDLDEDDFDDEYTVDKNIET